MAEKPDKPDNKLSAGKDAAWWIKEIGKSRKDWHDYREKATRVVERYRDDRDNPAEGVGANANQKRFSILYSNTETLGPAIYSQVPIPDIRRRWQDKDAVARVSAVVLQRAVQFCIESYDFNSVLDGCKQDYLLPGFAVARAKYNPYLKRDPRTGDDGKPQLDDTGEPAYDESIVYEEAATEYVPWDCFLMSRSKTYERVWWVAFGDDLTKDEVEMQFGKKIADQLSYGRQQEETDPQRPNQKEQTTRIWEVWSKRGRGRFCVAEGFQTWVKDPEPDPLRLEKFFPNARPIWAISTNNTLIPVPEYCEYQDQARELDDLTDRIDTLTSSLRRRGVYDQQFAALAQMLQAKTDNEFVAVENFAAFVEKGGLLNLAMEMPLEGLVAAIIQLEDRREKVKQIIYEVTGISDIVRGSSEPNETATAQSIKGKWAGLRISTRQRKFSEFARDLIRLKAEIIAERFKPETLEAMTGVKLPYQQQKLQWQQMQQAQQQQAQMAAQQAQQMGQQPPPPPQPNPEETKFFSQPTWEEVMAVLRNDKLRGFKIEIETDSTVQPDADTEKTARTELVTAIGQASQQLAAGVQTGIITQEFAKELFAFTLRAYKAGPAVDEALDSLGPSDGMSQAQQQKEQELQQREQAVADAENKAKDATHQAQMAGKDAQMKKLDADHAQDMFDLEQRMVSEVEKIKAEFASHMKTLVADAENTVRDIVGNIPQGAVQ